MAMDETARIEVIALTPAFAPVAAALHQTGFDDCWDENAICDLLNVPGAFGLLAFVPGSGHDDRDGDGTATVDDIPLGFVLVQTVVGEAEINTIVVGPAARRRGVGNILMENVFSHLQKQGVERLLLEVACDNEAAIALYRKSGFAEIGRRRGYYRRNGGPAMDALVMERV
ncbi:GNAT family N-acetyltransferase [Thalassospira mesophila]|uniref:Acetyltransferase n=1 Tax=Thalassospira mesophila TaxID=1293891 RepID=A0A1Y2L3E1_9PROT|nr:GNAT family N-acetyltransferase [Thalassospira mesophila]OSQ40346.1 acetyltransferase [Thalassospira mesophila]